eukprot:TRINITY_DN39226_c0_g1_i2.p2 TRINITY_DN39226_c0_g1~~TRINITY_DN39226_c0_g1_i2.p2  ORF type:complete len:100 (+),score=25.21 TRINITY_DN39226_c0_g1_i2:69-368(+)
MCNFACSCLCAYIVPPLGVYWRFGCGMEFWVNVILTLLGWVPGVIHAMCIIGCEDPTPSARECKEGLVAVGPGVAVTPYADGLKDDLETDGCAYAKLAA